MVIIMTRINIIDPSLLADQHLVAEYRELPMVPAALKRTLVSSRGYSVGRVPRKYTLNTGHVMFFYNKLNYLQDRYEQLIAEMKLRGMNPDPSRILNFDGIPAECFGAWTPSAVEQAVVVDRISLRLRQKPDWYRYKGVPTNAEHLISEMKTKLKLV